jgi:peptidoglycan/LPS O-acetylase OafA/YrhL
MGIKYRPEIDGLRTIAVLSVIIYHAELLFSGKQLLPGGFLGVDVFFVISGFLITSLMMKEFHETGTISIRSFYERRARRLLPALFVVMLVSMPFAWMYLLPEQLMDYAKSLISSLLFGSNFYWDYSLQQYGAESAFLKPFLHTWSLAVEEQYYIVFPLILLAMYKWCKSYIGALLATGFLLSLLFAEWMTSQDTSFSFYMLPSRFWELLAGGLLAYGLYLQPHKEIAALNKTMPVLGLFLIIYSVIFTEFNATHPGFITLLPVIGTMLIIWFASKDELVTKALSSKVFVFVGLISYSLYLWHYPIFAFFRIDGLFESNLGRVSAIALTFLFSAISVKALEKPFRSSKTVSNKVFIFFAILVSLLISYLGALVVVNKGYPDRFEGILILDKKGIKSAKAEYWDDHSAYTEINNFTPSETSIEVIGNSWAQDIANALVEAGGYQVGFRERTGPFCTAITLPGRSVGEKKYEEAQKLCPANIDKFQVKFPNTDLVIIADNRTLLNVDSKKVSSEIMKNIAALKLRGYSGPILIIANRPTYEKSVLSIIRSYGSSNGNVNLYAQRYLDTSAANMIEADEFAKSFYQKNGIYYYSLVKDFCRNEICKISDEGSPLYYDKNHLTAAGASYVGPSLSKFIQNKILNLKGRPLSSR